jgi:hypothetical protein
MVVLEKQQGFVERVICLYVAVRRLKSNVHGLGFEIGQDFEAVNLEVGRADVGAVFLGHCLQHNKMGTVDHWASVSYDFLVNLKSVAKLCSCYLLKALGATPSFHAQFGSGVNVGGLLEGRHHFIPSMHIHQKNALEV